MCPGTHLTLAQTQSFKLFKLFQCVNVINHWNCRMTIWLIGWSAGPPVQQIKQFQQLTHLMQFGEASAIGLSPANCVMHPCVNVPPAQFCETTKESLPSQFDSRICWIITPRAHVCDNSRKTLAFPFYVRMCYGHVSENVFGDSPGETIEVF